jgi:hypothetical protein
MTMYGVNVLDNGESHSFSEKSVENIENTSPERCPILCLLQVA